MRTAIGLDWAKRTLTSTSGKNFINRNIKITVIASKETFEVDSMDIIDSMCKKDGIKARKCFSKGKDEEVVGVNNDKAIAPSIMSEEDHQSQVHGMAKWKEEFLSGSEMTTFSGRKQRKSVFSPTRTGKFKWPEKEEVVSNFEEDAIEDLIENEAP